jgi:LysM repeat protein
VEPADQDLWADHDTALGLLTGEEGETEYTVVSGDISGRIAEQHNLTLPELAELNPGVNLHRLQVGQTLTVRGKEAPLLTVVCEGETRGTLAIPYATRRMVSPRMYAGKSFVGIPGSPGRQQVVYRARYENGVLVNREVVSRRTVSSPRHQLVVIGSKPRPRG